MEYLSRFFSPEASSPLLFTQANFWIFFGVVLFVFSFVYRQIRIRNVVLLLSNLFFYYRAGGLFSMVFIAIILLNFYLAKFCSGKDDKRQRKLILWLSLLINLGLLIFFKYSSFVLSLINVTGDLNFSKSFSGNFGDLIVPIGISFFTFQLVSYSIEVYRKKIEPVRNLIDFGVYISFFPNLISGPLVKPQEFIPQVSQQFQLSREDFGSAVFLILTGLIKKIVIADYISVNFVSRVFENPHLFSGFENLVAIYGYALQIYCDFSGYTDIAIGVALLLGFRLPPNFNSPYRARNINEFWKRWHMSLTTWFRDYLFLPMAYQLSGKMTQKYYLKIRTEKWIYLFSILFTFLLCGLWHGAAINFVIWGGIHGIALIIHKFIYPKIRLNKTKNSLRLFLSGFITFQFVVFTWIIFRVSGRDSFLIMMNKIAFHFHAGLIPVILISYWKILVVMMLGFIMVWFPESLKSRVKNSFLLLSDPVKAIMVFLIIIFVYQFKVSNIQPFIYFQF